MTRDELDKLWQQALVASVAAGEKYTRYHFAAMVAAAEREACAKFGMTREELDTMWQEATYLSIFYNEKHNHYYFAKLVAVAEADKHDTGTHTCSKRCQRYACVAVREAVAAEREAILEMLDDNWYKTQSDVAAAIRARGEV